MAKSGYADTNKDDYDEQTGLLKELQDLALGAKHRQVCHLVSQNPFNADNQRWGRRSKPQKLTLDKSVWSQL